MAVDASQVTLEVDERVDRPTPLLLRKGRIV